MPIQPVGYLKLWRELLTKPIWLNSTPEQKSILIALLSMANFNPKQWEWKGEKFEVKPGQFVTSIQSIVDCCGKGVTPQNVRTALKRFEKLEFLTNESTKTGRLITIENWALYQSDEKNQQSNQQSPNKELTKTQQRANKELTPREEGNKDKKDKEGNKETNNSSLERGSNRVLKFANDRSSIQFQLAGHLAKRMRDNNPECKLPKERSKQLDDWCIEIDRMIRIDGREPEAIREVIDWCQSDDFWKSNILSPKSLRKQYDKLVVKMQRPATKMDRMKQNALRPEIQAWLAKDKEEQNESK